MSEWNCVLLSELITSGRTISYGIVQPGSHQENGVPMLRVSDIRNGRIAVEEPMRVSSQIEAAHARTRLRGGELLLTLVGTVGEVAVVPPELEGWNVARAVAVIPVREDIGAYWVKLALSAPNVRGMIHGRMNTTVQATLNLQDVAQLPVLMPDADERASISRVIGTLDDKIELNRRMNETLEAMARAIFQSWFVDFDPVRAKASGESSDSICQRLGLTPELLALFPDSFEESELGAIPRGWEVGPLELMLVLQRGFDLPASDRKPGKYPILASSGPSGTHTEYMVHGPGVTTGRSGVLGKVFYVQEPYWPLNTSLWVKEFKRAKPAYAFHLLRRLDFNGLNAGSAVPTLNRNHAHAVRVVVPPQAVIDAFEPMAEMLLTQQRKSTAQTDTVAAIRDTLLPKLLSGELVPNEMGGV